MSGYFEERLLSWFRELHHGGRNAVVSNPTTAAVALLFFHWEEASGFMSADILWCHEEPLSVNVHPPGTTILHHRMGSLLWCYRQRVLDPDHCVPRATGTEMQTQRQHKPVKWINQLWLHPLEATAETLAANDITKMDWVSNSSNVVDVSSLFARDVTSPWRCGAVFIERQNCGS